MSAPCFVRTPGGRPLEVPPLPRAAACVRASCRCEAARACRCSCPRWSSSPRERPPYSARYSTPSRQEASPSREEPSANETNHPTQRRSHHLICHHRCAWGSISSASDPALRDALTMRCDPFRSRPCFRRPCLTLACRRAVAGNCAASAAAVSAGDPPLAPTQASQRGAEDPALLVPALQPPQLLERQTVAGDTSGPPVTGACDDTYSMLWRRAGGESLAAATAAVGQRVGACGDRRGRSVCAGRRAAAGATRRRCSPQRSRFLRGAGGADATADR